MVQIVLLVVITKALMFIYLINHEFNAPYGKLGLDSWWLIFHRWDSAFYDRIASVGYTELRYFAYMPAFPAAIKAVNVLVNHSGISTVITGFVLGILWIPLYYKVAESYVGNRYAKISTVLFAFFPTVYLFTSVGYTEGLWLTTSLLGWYFYRKDTHLLSGITLTVSALTKLPGIILPMFIFLHQLTQKKVKQALAYLLPALGLGFWAWYAFTQTGEAFAPVAALTKTVWNPHLNFVDVFLVPLFKSQSLSHWNEYSVFLILVLAFFAYFYLKSYEVDKLLGIYSLSLFGVYLYSAYFLSLPRYLPFTFPIWLGIKVKKKFLIIYVVGCLLLALMLWMQFLNDLWAG
jgi:Gpi18-like mannosyltransferase